MTNNLYWNRLSEKLLQFLLREKFYAHFVFYLLYFSCFCENWLIKGLGMLSHREPKWGQWFFSKVIRDLWVLQIQHTWVAILVIVFCKKREVNYVTFSFWRQDRETEHFWIKVFHSVILILQTKDLTFWLFKTLIWSHSTVICHWYM